jgi:hypothetical protein
MVTRLIGKEQKEKINVFEFEGIDGKKINCTIKTQKSQK